MRTNADFRKKKLRRTASLLLLILGLLTSNINFAQINFENNTWEQIKAKSVQANKLIFLDAYASWCGVCKRMDKNVFTNDSVANYYNANFINAKVDMESGEGIDLARQYKVNVYPTLLFIDQKGEVIHRAVGSMQPQEFIEFAKEAQNPGKQNAGATNSNAATPDAKQRSSNRMQIGFNVSQYQRDFGIGLHVVSPYFFMKTVALKAGSNIQWLEHSNDTTTGTTMYQNIQIGMRGRSALVTDNISIYGEGGVFVILPNGDFSSKSSVVGGYGLFGFEFRIASSLGYFIELGGIGTGATADKLADKPIYSNGFLTNVGFRISL